MNILSFADELMKIGAMDALMGKHAYSATMPAGMVGSEPPPEEEILRPDEATGRLPRTGHYKSQVESGLLGSISASKDPIDQPTFNRAYGSGTTRQNR